MGQILKGLVYRVEKLMFIPLNVKGDMKIDINDQQYIDMIKHVQKEKSFYFSYDMDLTKNMQATFQDIQNFQPNSYGSSGYQNDQTFRMMREAYPNSVDYVQRFAFNDKLLQEF